MSKITSRNLPDEMAKFRKEADELRAARRTEFPPPKTNTGEHRSSLPARAVYSAGALCCLTGLLAQFAGEGKAGVTLCVAGALLVGVALALVPNDKGDRHE